MIVFLRKLMWVDFFKRYLWWKMIILFHIRYWSGILKKDWRENLGSWTQLFPVQLDNSSHPHWLFPHYFSTHVIKTKVCGCYSVLFHVLWLLLIRSTQRNLCCNSKSTRKHQQKSDEYVNPHTQTHYDLVRVIKNACLVVFLIEYMGLWNCVQYQVWST